MIYAFYMGIGETGIRSVAANLILGKQGSLVLRRLEHGYEFTGVEEKSRLFCARWSEVERTLLLLEVPFHKIDEIAGLIKAGSDVAVHRTVGK